MNIVKFLRHPFLQNTSGRLLLETKLLRITSRWNKCYFLVLRQTKIIYLFITQTLEESCQQWELTFLSTVAYRPTKIPTTLRVDVHVAIRATKNLEDTMLSINYRSLFFLFVIFFYHFLKYIH